MTWCADRDPRPRGRQERSSTGASSRALSGGGQGEEGPSTGSCTLEPAGSAAPSPAQHTCDQNLVRGAWLGVPQRAAFPSFRFARVASSEKQLGLPGHRCFPTRIHAENKQPNGTVGHARVKTFSAATGEFPFPESKEGRSVCATRSRRKSSGDGSGGRGDGASGRPGAKKGRRGGILAVSLVSTWDPTEPTSAT